MTDPKDDLPKTDMDVPTKEPTPEPGIETPDEGLPPEGEEATIFVGDEDEVPTDDPDDVKREPRDRRS